ncbi:MAG: ABC transporter ATP-binding protein [Sporocytophaga sp.]|uniref:ABC transporter ATP-binding protein n=1 Tax=Sporocytophaga sp. TaxID=2231183 RepID=UPI001B204E51|nr:ABC transporter ATP-binding protein [Sporocytophaga sp.]MBO9698672.1 ABC transporter ATP-binding protein [Sporocytophaga sp.]
MLRKPSQGKNNPTLTERYGALKNLLPFFKIIWKASPSMAVSNGVLRIVKGIIPLMMLLIARKIIDEIVMISGHQTEVTSRLWILVGSEFALAILSDLLSRAIALLDSLLGDLVANSTSLKLMDHAAQLDMNHFEDSEFYDKLERARRQTLGRTVLMSQVLSQMQDAISLAGLSAGLILFNPWLILLLLIAVIPAFLGEAHFNEKTYSLVHGQTPERRELDYIRYIGASDETAKEVKIFNLSDFLKSRFAELSSKFYKANKALASKRAMWGGALAAIGSAGYYGAYVFIIIKTVNGNLSLGDLTFLAGSFNQLRSLLQSMLTRFSTIAEGSLYLKDLFDFFELKPEIISPITPRPFPNPIQQGFLFENIGFKYKHAEKWAIRNLNFTLNAGEKLALVGENGAGKTTLVKLLARLYDPTEGRILLDGYDIKEYDVLELRSGIGVIFQDFVRFQMTAGNNIAVGRIEQKENTSRIEHAASKSLADSVILKLPKGYEQVIGRRFAEGVDLSGGEWQKIALGRAYMRDAQVLILDEPTAALDARAEHEVFVRFSELTKGKTAVLISHRFSTVRMADRILVIENGQLLEIGSHEELLKKEGRYAELFNLQARGYL